MTRKTRRSREALDQDEIERMERENEIERQPQSDVERFQAVGEDPRLYEVEELKRQGYTDEGLTNQSGEEERVPKAKESGRRAA